ncbi:MAG TPA: hypothetical protein VN253_25405 [Kofleriaceae bacterium]|nr:hypothetical protein [Kofleriaceae bacterium]
MASIGFVAGCGDDGGGGAVDAKTIDAPIDSPPAQLGCASYCSSIMSNCTGSVQQYTSMSDCMSSCARFPVGTAADMSGNTLGCRTYHAGAAAGAPAVHCRHAGPGGNGACGGDCEGFCTVVLGSCTGANLQYNGDMATCMTACNGFATNPPYNTMQTGGNTFACRLYHATVASGAPNVHCPHTAVASGPCQ